MTKFNFSSFTPTPELIKTWVLVGAATGAFLAGCRKICDILAEPEATYDFPLLERPIRGVYHMSRIAAYTGMGAFIAGACALTAPVSIPGYILYLNYKHPQTKIEQ